MKLSLQPCLTAGREPKSVRCRKDGSLHGSRLLPLSRCVAWGELLALSGAWFLVWETRSSQCQPPQVVPKPREPNTGQRRSARHPAAVLASGLPCQSHQAFSWAQSQEMAGQGLQGPAVPEPPASAACSRTGSASGRSPPLPRKC